MARWPAKDPNEIIDYELLWSRRLDQGDTITDAEFSLTTAAGLVIATQSFADDTAKVWLTDGNAGETAEVLCRVQTAGGRALDWSMSLTIAER